MTIKLLKKNFPKTNKLVFFCVTIFAVFLSVYTIVEFCNLTYTVFPEYYMDDRITVFNDKGWNGNSKVEEFSYDTDELVLKYVLKSDAEIPLVFISFTLGSIDHTLDLSAYDSISFRIKEATCKSIVLFIKTYLPGISRPESRNAHTLRHNQFVLRLFPNREQYNIRLNDFITPSWWIDIMKVNEVLLPKESFKKVLAFDMQFNHICSDYIINKPEQVIIESIIFHRSLSLLNYIFIGMVLCYYVGVGFVLIRRKLKSKLWKLPKQKSLELESYREKELTLIKNFIEDHYNDPNISTRMVYEELGIPSVRVFDILKQEYHLSFKQLINTMRLEEAKRLLLETDLRITEIVLNLGFNNISYFNTLFKMHMGETPSDYRKKSKGRK